jgi:hypothetical protein
MESHATNCLLAEGFTTYAACAESVAPSETPLRTGSESSDDRDRATRWAVHLYVPESGRKVSSAMAGWSAWPMIRNSSWMSGARPSRFLISAILRASNYGLFYATSQYCENRCAYEVAFRPSYPRPCYLACG